MRKSASFFAALLTAAAVSAAPVKYTGNKAVLQRIYDAMNSNDATALEQVVSVNAVTHDLPAGMTPGVRGVEELLVVLNRAFPDFKIVVQDMITERDRVAARIMFTGTHEGEFLGIARTGRQVAYTGIQYFQFANGKAVEMWSFMDHERLKRQLAPVANKPAEAAPAKAPTAK
jgi:steroid delta-isomerase-like uncharacterized protein